MSTVVEQMYLISFITFFFMSNNVFKHQWRFKIQNICRIEIEKNIIFPIATTTEVFDVHDRG